MERENVSSSRQWHEDMENIQENNEKQFFFFHVFYTHAKIQIQENNKLRAQSLLRYSFSSNRCYLYHNQTKCQIIICRVVCMETIFPVLVLIYKILVVPRRIQDENIEFIWVFIQQKFSQIQIHSNVPCCVLQRSNLWYDKWQILTMLFTNCVQRWSMRMSISMHVISFESVSIETWSESVTNIFSSSWRNNNVCCFFDGDYEF